MRIGFNCLHIIPRRLGGLETYIHGLLEDVGKFPATVELTIFCSSQYKSVFKKYESRFSIVDFPVNVHSAARRIYFEQFVLPRQLPKYDIDVLHSSGYTAPITRYCQTVISIHDLNYLEIPRVIRQSHGTLRWVAMRWLGPLCLKKANRLLTISDHVRHQISRRLRIDPTKITTIAARSPCDFSQVVAKPFQLPPAFERDFLLYVASWLPHKNHQVLFQALAEAKQRSIVLPRLILAGLHLRSEAYRAAIHAELRRFGVEEQVHCVEDHLSLENLAYLYQQCQIFVFPSYYEGFGIPIVEAMSAKRPVLCSNIETLREVAEDAALMFSPNNPLELLSHLTKLSADQELRKQLADRGYQRFQVLQRATESNTTELFRVYSSLVET